MLGTEELSWLHGCIVAPPSFPVPLVQLKYQDTFIEDGITEMSLEIS
jgi:hypothetical protein